MKVRNVANTANPYKAHRKVCIGWMKEVLQASRASGFVRSVARSSGQRRVIAQVESHHLPDRDGGKLVSAAAI